MIIPQPNPTLQARNAFRATLLYFLGAMAGTFVYIYFAFQNNAWQLFALTGISCAICAVALISLALSQRGYPVLAIKLLIGATLLVLLLLPTLISGFGLIGGLGAVLLTMAISSHALPRQEVRRILMISVAVGLIAGLIDVVAPSTQLSIPGLPTFLGILASLLLLTYVGLILRHFHAYPLLNKMVATFLALALIPVVALAYLNNRTTQEALVHNVSINLESLARTHAPAVGDMLAQQLGILQAIGHSASIQHHLTAANARYTGQAGTIHAEIEHLNQRWHSAEADDPLVLYIGNNPLAQELTKFHQALQDHMTILVTDRYGALVAASSRPGDYFQADKPWWQAAYKNGTGTTYIGQPTFDPTHNTVVTTLAIPIYEPGNQTVAGILHTTYRLTPLATLLSTTQIGQTGRADLYLPGGLQLGPDGNQLLPAEFDLNLAAADGSTFHQKNALLSRAPIAATTNPAIANLGWNVVVHQNRGEILAPAMTQTHTTLLFAVVIASLASAGAVAVARVLTNPVLQLTELADRLTAGDLSVRARITSQDEIGVLATTFNALAERVGSLLKGMERHTNELEASQRVAMAASQSTSPTELLRRIATLIQEQFDLYQVHIYLVDETEQAAILRGSTGAAGSAMLDLHHKIPLDRRDLVTRTIRAGQPMLSADAHFIASPLLPDTRAQLVLPLRLPGRQGRVIGALDLYSQTTDRFSPGTITLLQTMTEQLALLLENSNLLSSVSAHAQALRGFSTQLRIAADMAEQLNAILEPELLIREAVKQLQQHFGLYHVHIYLFDEETRSLVVAAASGEIGRQLREQSYSIPLDRKRSLVAWAARTHEVVLAADVNNDPRFLPNPLLPETRAEVSIPLIVRGKLLGVLDMQDSRAHRFTDADIDVFSTLAGQIATALQNARLFEEVQQTAERLRELDRLKSEFLANMSHELRTPLNSIIGYSEIILMGIDGDVEAELQQDIQAIYNNGQHLLCLINDILDLAKIEAGRMQLSIEDVHLGVLIEDVSVATASLFSKKGIDLKIEMEKGLPLITADPVRLNQVLTNLVSNAVKFTEQGHICLRAARINDTHVSIQVADTGIGMSATDLEKIFEKFRQVDGSTKRRAEGTGLGLAITRSLIELHHGTITVESELGQGSIFTVTLPIHHPATASATLATLAA